MPTPTLPPPPTPPMQVTWTSALEGSDAREYDALVLASPAGHPAQTRAWAEVARAGAHVAARYALVRLAGRAVGAALVLRPSLAGLGLPWAWIERGPVVAAVGDLAGVTRAVARAARRRGIARLRVNPYFADGDAAVAEESLRGLGFRDVQRADGPHAATLRLAVGGRSDAEILAGKTREQLRWRIKQADKAGAVARRGEPGDWPRLREMVRDLMRSQSRRDRPDAWWDALRRHVADDARGAFFVCDHGGRVVAGAVYLRHGSRVIYGWGAAVAEKLGFSKAIPAHVAAIRWSRDAGCDSFDLGGIPLEDDADPKRNAIATFKLLFDRTRVRLVREHAGWC